MSPPRPIRRLAIANRGEIALRIMRTASAMGIESVALVTPAETSAPFARAADRLEPLRGGYLDIDAVVGACVSAGADAVHPGYGFLSERPDFARAVVAAGLTWVGPPPEAMELLGDKLAAKRLVSAHGVPVLPSFEVTADRIPAVEFPALVKAAAGGGGKGMQLVSSAEELDVALAQARREAETAFGDGTVFVERYVADARHVEVQILADDHGAVVHCFERECSVQRRHQKIVEEAPSPSLDPGLRDRMAAAALAAARAADYRSAGTVEFVLAPDGEFYFLEVNARLQVEHPVTEAVTGLDLVREQLRVAQGLPLSVAQDDIVHGGHAMEARLYAEDPGAGFLPATGTVIDWAVPVNPSVRWETGVDVGSVVGVSYDPMLAKVIAYAPTRAEAAGRLALALSRLRLRGVQTNRDFLTALLRHPTFLAGPVTTTFVEREAISARFRPNTEQSRQVLIATALFEQVLAREADRTFAAVSSGLTLAPMPFQRRRYELGEEQHTVEYRRRRDGSFDVRIGDWAGRAELQHVRRDDGAASGAELCLEVEGHLVTGHILLHEDRVWFQAADGDTELYRLPRFPVSAPAMAPGTLVSPMPGSVVEVVVEPGDAVEAGGLLAVIEAMKMEHRLTAPHAGVVREVRAKAGQQVTAGDPLVIVTADGGDTLGAARTPPQPVAEQVRPISAL